ncbi:hypothetical protein DPMN_189165 [Dreissena polymorpha]|uniref:Uncharacterized protein n=1 Tax=Dreissena polymorpha TaxID=45954 RepID=A0A9D4DUG0_DREPO|nr:hypothetical protein DPMN_189165 [Dreissena polymorpha]
METTALTTKISRHSVGNTVSVSHLHSWKLRLLQPRYLVIVLATQCQLVICSHGNYGSYNQDISS